MDYDKPITLQIFTQVMGGYGVYIVFHVKPYPVYALVIHSQKTVVVC